MLMPGYDTCLLLLTNRRYAGGPTVALLMHNLGQSLMKCFIFQNQFYQILGRHRRTTN